MDRIRVVFFDIGDTLGTVELSPTGDRLVRIVPFSSVADVLQELNRIGVRLGIISNRGNVPEDEVKRVLQESGLYEFFDPSLIIFGAKDSVEIFLQAATQAGQADSRNRCLFVGEDRSERNFAAAAGLRVANHPNAALNTVRLNNA